MGRCQQRLWERCEHWLTRQKNVKCHTIVPVPDVILAASSQATRENASKLKSWRFRAEASDPTIGWIADICTIILGVYIFTGILYYTFRPANKKFKAQAIRSKRQMTQLAKVTSMGSTMISVLVGQFQIISVIIYQQ